MFHDNFKVTGELHIVLRDEFGNIKQEQIVPNLVVTAGKVLIALRLSGGGTAPSHMGIGSGSTAPGASDTALGTELSTGARPSMTITPSTNTVTYVGVFAPGVGTGAVTEAAIFNAAATGTMLCRTTFGVVTKAAADTLTINWTVTVN